MIRYPNLYFIALDPLLYSRQQIFNTAIMQELEAQSDEKYCFATDQGLCLLKQSLPYYDSQQID